ncbi:MAG: DGQHR domain-containing protein [Oscillospiraceae bacterium]|nr:DGQHR domain-containing protein [Oscillospiraceae bacterium]
MDQDSQEYRYIKTSFNEQPIYSFSMKVKDLLNITYVAARGVRNEEGAVQRVLNKRRIDDIRDFILAGNTFVNSFILNWTDQANEPKVKKDEISIPLNDRRAQLLDGQHRAAGLKEAIRKDRSVGEQEILVSMCIGLTTPDAARIFLNINSEQKPVPKSLIYDLFGEAVDNREIAINRVTDIIKYLNTTPSSPFFETVKYPGNVRTTGGLMIDLSIMVNAMKPYFEKDGVFNQMQISEIEIQQKIIFNFYSALKEIYNEADGLWDKKKENIFFKASGFSGAFEFLALTLLPRCNLDKNFKKDRMRELMNLKDVDLITMSELKNLEGKSAKKSVTTFFNKYFHLQENQENEYEL